MAGVNLEKFNKNSLKNMIEAQVKDNQSSVKTIDLIPLYKKYISEEPPLIIPDTSLKVDDINFKSQISNQISTDDENKDNQ